MNFLTSPIVKNTFTCDAYLVQKTKFGWIAKHGSTLLTTDKSANSKAGAFADCEAHAAKK